MKARLFILALFAAIGVTAGAQTQETAYDTNRGFVHPGGLHTQADFDRIKAQLAAGNPTVKAAYQKLTSAAYAQANVQTYPTETIVRGGGSGENYMNACRGAAIGALVICVLDTACSLGLPLTLVKQLPLSELGFAWVPFAMLGCLIGALLPDRGGAEETAAPEGNLSSDSNADPEPTPVTTIIGILPQLFHRRNQG